MTSIVFNSVPMEEIETTWGSQPQVARVKTVIREIKRYVSMQEPLNLPGRKTRSKNFKTPFFSRYQKILPWGNSNGSKTSPNFFLKKYLNKYGR